MKYIDVNDSEIARYTEGVKELISGRVMKYFVITLGCQQNEADSEKLCAMAEKMGYHPAERAEDARLILVNTCAIRHHAEQKALSMIGTLKHVKVAHPDTVIGVCGCMAAEKHVVELLKTSFHYVSFTLEPNLLYRFPQLLYTALVEKRRSFVFGEDEGDLAEGLSAVRSSSHRAWVSIMYGCNNFCSYCIVPYVRGRERSRPSEAIIAECRDLIARGYREITLLGQNVNSYRADITFAELVCRICEIEGEFILRFMTSHPKDVSDELILAMKKYGDKLAPAFHLPLQSGSDRILSLMNRTYTSEKYLSIVDKLREAVPDIAITTDIIVAFPGETEEDFQKTLQIARRVGYDSMFSFIYSKREGTRAAKLENTITDEEKRDRMARLLALARESSYEKNSALVGRSVRVLTDGSDKDEENAYIGRTDTGKLVRFTSDEDCIGKFVRVRIERATPYDLFGKIEK